MSEPVWTENHDNFLRLMKLGKVADMKELIMKIDPKASHIFRNAHFNMLFHASMENSKQGFNILIDAKADPTWKNESGNSVMKLIMNRNQHDMLRSSLKHLKGDQKKRFVNEATANGWSALMSAAENNNHEIACTLVDNGAEINAQMTSGWTAMHAASKVENKKTLEFFLQKGGNKNLQGNHRNFGAILKVQDVTMYPTVLDILNKY